MGSKRLVGVSLMLFFPVHSPQTGRDKAVFSDHIARHGVSTEPAFLLFIAPANNRFTLSFSCKLQQRLLKCFVMLWVCFGLGDGIVINLQLVEAAVPREAHYEK